MKDIKRYEIDGLKAYVDCKDPKFKLKDFESWDGDICFYSDHKAVVETLEKDIEISGKAVEDLIDLVDELKADKVTMQNKIDSLEEMREKLFDSNVDKDIELKLRENKIEELKNVIGGVYTGYYCAEHGAINGVEVTYYEKCAICGRDANHVPDSKGD